MEVIPMPVLFFVLVVVVPFAISCFFFQDVSVVEEYLAAFSIPAIIAGYIFRSRTVGRAYVVSDRSLEFYPLMALGAGLSSLAGIFLPDPWILASLLFVGAVLTIWALVEGPVYGWRKT